MCPDSETGPAAGGSWSDPRHSLSDALALRRAIRAYRDWEEYQGFDSHGGASDREVIRLIALIASYFPKESKDPGSSRKPRVPWKAI